MVNLAIAVAPLASAALFNPSKLVPVSSVPASH